MAQRRVHLSVDSGELYSIQIELDSTSGNMLCIIFLQKRKLLKFKAFRKVYDTAYDVISEIMLKLSL